MRDQRADAPAEYDRQIISAVTAFMQGLASDGQQIIVRDWILHNVCQVDGSAYYRGADGDRDTAFALGKRYVANSLRKMTNPITRAAQDMKDSAEAAKEEAKK
jgi:hypothetical protein